MISKWIFVILLVALMTAVGFTQGTFRPRNADEEHAWRLYNQYKESKKKEAELRQGITQASGDIRTVNVGSVPGLGIDPADVARLQQLRADLVIEGEKQQKLEAAWDKKFWGRYGDLKDSSGSIYDPKTKTNMDKIRYRLMYFPFYVNDGTYTGTISGASGSITLIVSGTSVKGTVKGVYSYEFGSSTFSDPFSGTVTGSIDNRSGSLNAVLSGKVGTAAFTGALTGTLNKGVISGSWTSKASESASGTFIARRK